MSDNPRKVTPQVLVYVGLIMQLDLRDLSSSKRASQEDPALGLAKPQRRPDSPLLRLQARRWVPGDEEEGSHGMHVAESCKRAKQGPAQVRMPNPVRTALRPHRPSEQSQKTAKLLCAEHSTERMSNHRCLIKFAYQLSTVNISTSISYVRKPS